VLSAPGRQFHRNHAQAERRAFLDGKVVLSKHRHISSNCVLPHFFMTNDCLKVESPDTIRLVETYKSDFRRALRRLSRICCVSSLEQVNVDSLGPLTVQQVKAHQLANGEEGIVVFPDCRSCEVDVLSALCGNEARAMFEVQVLYAAHHPARDLACDL
jgi:hypothetical protein